MKDNINIIRKFSIYIKRHYVILLAFFLPAFILEIAYITVRIFPFGNWSLLISDLYHQYAPFTADFQDKLRSSSSLLYSWSGGLGINFLPLFAYYLASPINLITILFPPEYLTEVVLVLTLIKVGLAGSCFALYLKAQHGEQNLITVGFSLLYALSGFVLAFCWNIMWMDAIYLLPLIMIGLINLIREGKGLFFCITLAIALLSNFYMAFFICFFTLLYYPVCLFKYHDFKKPSLLIKITGQFAGFSLLSVGLSAIILLPTFFQLKSTSAAGDIFPKTLTNYFDLFDYITRHFTAASPSIREGAPNMYCGIVVLILIPIYFLSKSIPLKEKLWNLALVLVLTLSFNINILNFIWHGFHYPNQLPYRFSFVYIFLVLSMSYEGFRNLNEFSGKQIGNICLSILGVILISQKFDDLSIGFHTIYISATFIILYAVALTIDRSCNIRPSLKTLIVFLVLTAEITTNTIATIVKIDFTEGYSTRSNYASGSEVTQLRDQISDISKKDKGFYRLEILPSQTTNDPALYNYRGISIFSSTISAKPVKMLENLGYSSNGINSYSYEGSTAILDSLLGIKYLIYRNLAIEENLYKQTASTNNLRIFTNPYVLPLGFQSTSKLKEFDSSSGANPLETQNLLIKAICGVSNILIPIKQKQGIQRNLNISGQDSQYYSFKRPNNDIASKAIIDFTIDKAQQVYLYYKAPSNMKGNGFVTANGKKVEFNPSHSSIINLGFCKPGSSAELKINFDKSSAETGQFKVYAYTLNIPAFKEAIFLIRKKSMTIENFTDTSISGQVDATSDGLMVMSIPFDKGWHVKVDNHEVKPQAVDDCLLSFELLKGTHKIELWFFPEKLFMGLMITLVSVLILIFLFIKKPGIMFSTIKHLRRGGK
ncbi:YfhO family protein [Clostridium bowmanii]|uniref:YfhO family protein n=1 Tax=Clostridium bowmanii TaxID=132925 RepID=UPI001C0C9945|nr:YfhO family protein [Clostridium bowmanii]MBU3191374.1 YfhO family protein [Clostridium bowmanii]MCA1075781.1 YfhO family protein [Clostridium bowmanii]